MKLCVQVTYQWSYNGQLRQPTSFHVRKVLLTSISCWTLPNGEDLPQVFLFLREALLETLQFAQTLTPLMFHGAHVLDEVQFGLGGVVAEDTVIIAAFTLDPTLMMLKVL